MDVLLFTFDLGYASAAMRAGVAGVVVDWEWRGKSRRQIGQDTEINCGTPDDLRRMRAAFPGHLVCRINNQPDTRTHEARLAIALGADEIWLPMVRNLVEVVECLRVIDGKAELGILAETRDALDLAKDLSKLPLSRVYVGLHDLRIDTGGGTLFAPLCDGRIERFRDAYTGRFGFAGITRPDGGRPVPQRLLLGEMARLGCEFGVARRAFRADVPPVDIASTLASIEAEVARLNRRDASQIEHDRGLLVQATTTAVAECSPCG